MRNREVSIVVFYDANGRVLMEDRRENSRYGEEWGFFGGGLEGNESKEDTLRREVFEELDYDIKDFNYIDTYFGKIRETEVIEHMFISEFPGWEFLSVGEEDGASFFRFGEIKSLKLMNTHYNILDDVERFLKENIF